MWKHAFVSFWLAIAAVLALVDESLSAVSRAAALVLLVVLGGWYGYWYVARTTSRDREHRIYLAGAVAVWALLVAIDPSFLIVGVTVVAGRCLDDLRWALALLVPCAGAWLWSLAAAGTLDWVEVAMVLLFLASGTTVAGYTRALAHQNAERQRLIDQLQATQSELAAAERRAGVLAERQRLARDIHDTLTQGFASIVMLLEAAEASQNAQHASARHVRAALRSARDNLTESRRLVWALRPDALAGGGLPRAIGQLIDRLGDETGLRCELVVTGTPRSLGERVETALLRIAQEALANVRRHARATRATVTISYMDDLTVLDVQDDGTGFRPATNAPTTPTGGLGLRAMQERAEELDGRLTVESTPGEGTTVAVEIPLAPTEPTSMPSPSARAGPAPAGTPSGVPRPPSAAAAREAVPHGEGGVS